MPGLGLRRRSNVNSIIRNRNYSNSSHFRQDSPGKVVKMNLPTYEAIEAMIKLDKSKPVSLEEWKRRVFHTTIDTVKMMNKTQSAKLNNLDCNKGGD